MIIDNIQEFDRYVGLNPLFPAVASLPGGIYDEAADMTMHDPAAPQTSADVTHTYFRLRPGQFAIFFPADGHAPAISPTGLHKAIIKVKA